MLGAQTVTRSTDPSDETKTPMVDSIIHDRLVKLACPLVNQMRFKFVDVSYSGSVNFLQHYTPDAIVDWVRWIRRSKFWKMKSGTFRSRKAMVSRARCAIALSCWKTKPHPRITGICLAVAFWQEDCRDSMPHSLWHPARKNRFQCSH